jgi:type IV secretory pathway VirB4 component
MQRHSHGRPLNQEIPLFGFLSDREFLTKCGDVGTVMVSTPQDPECMTPDEMLEISDRVARSFRLFDEGYKLYQYLFRRKGFRLGCSATGNAVLDEAQKARGELLAGLYQNETYTVILRLASPKDATPSLSLGNTRRSIKVGVEMRQAELSQHVDSWMEHCAGFWPHRLATKAESFRFLRRLMNLDDVNAVPLNGDDFLDYRILDSDLHFGNGDQRLGEKYFHILSLKDVPPEPRPYILGGIASLEADVNLCIEMQALVIDEQRKKLRHAKSNQASQATGARAAGGKEKHERMQDQGKLANVEALGEAQRQLELRNYLGLFSLSVLVHSDSIEGADKAASSVKAMMNGRDCRVHKEGWINRENALFSMIPGGYRTNFRHLRLLNSNAAKLSLCFGVDQGRPINAALRKESLVVLETKQATPYQLNLHGASGVAHTLMLGMTGAGKSFLLNFLITNLQKYRPYTLIFDLGGSFEHLTKLFRGSYTRLQFHKSKVRMNPFAGEPSESRVQFLTVMVSVLIEQRGTPLTGADEDAIYQGIVRLYGREERTLSRLVATLPEHLAIQLKQWHGAGQHAWLFDNGEDTVSLAEFQTFDFQGMEKYPELLEPLFLYIFQRADEMIHDPAAADRLKGFFADEAWVFLRNPRVANYMMEALKTWRKRNAFVVLSTQSASELTSSEIWNVIAECCATRFFLWNPGMDSEEYAKRFHLNATKIAAIRNLEAQQGFLFDTPFSSKELLLNVDDKSKWIYANDPASNAKRQEAIERYGEENWVGGLVGGNGIHSGAVHAAG